MEPGWPETEVSGVRNKEAESPDASTAVFIRLMVLNGKDPAGQQPGSRIEPVVVCHGSTIPSRELREDCPCLLIRGKSF